MIFTHCILGFALTAANQASVMPLVSVVLREQATTFLEEKDYTLSRKFIERWQFLPKPCKIVLLETLACRLSSNKRIKLVNTEDMIIPSRLFSGDMQWPGHGYVIRQDLFVAGGKAAWAIAELIGTELPEVTEGQTKKERAAMAVKIEQRIKEYAKGAK